MSHEPDRERGRESELHKSILDLRRDIDSDLQTAPVEVRRVLSQMARVLSILNSEYGTIMRIEDRQDRTNALLFGNGEGPDGSLVAKVDRIHGAFKFVKKAFATIVIALAVMVATSWYEKVKLNEIIAAQKVQAAKP